MFLLVSHCETPSEEGSWQVFINISYLPKVRSHGKEPAFPECGGLQRKLMIVTRIYLPPAQGEEIVDI